MHFKNFHREEVLSYSLRLKVYILIADDYEFSHFIKHSSMPLLPTFSKVQYHNNETIKNSLKFSYKGSGDTFQIPSVINTQSKG